MKVFFIDKMTVDGCCLLESADGRGGGSGDVLADAVFGQFAGQVRFARSRRSADDHSSVLTQQRDVPDNNTYIHPNNNKLIPSYHLITI